MIIHLSILGMILFVSILWDSGTKKIKNKKVEYIMPMVPFLLVFGYLTILATMRTSINDTVAYIASFNGVEGSYSDIFSIISSDGRDKGFNILANLFKMYISKDYHMWFAMFAIIESLCFIYILRRESLSILISMFYLFASSLYYNYFSMMRQWFAISILFFAFKFLKLKRFLPYCLLCILVAQIHNSAYLCIPVYFIVQSKPFCRQQFFYALIFCIGIFLLNPLLASLENLNGTYNYVFQTMSQSSGSSPVRILVSFVPIGICFFYRRRVAELNSKSLNLSLNLSMINFALTIIATFTSGLFIIRMATYFEVFNMILMPYIMERIICGKNAIIIKYGFYICYLIFYFYQMTHLGAWGYGSDILGYFY